MFQVIHLTEIDSTNEDAKRRLSAGTVQAPLVIRADSQTAGRGTRGRSWFSPPGAGLYFSIVHPSPGVLSLREGDRLEDDTADGAFDGFSDWPLLTSAAGVACVTVLRERTGVPVALKPVNDLYVGARKLGGILCESLLRGSSEMIREEIGTGHPSPVRGIITGIGLNILDNPYIEAACRNERRAPDEEGRMGRNHPISLQGCIPPLLFARWNPDALKTELCLTLARQVDREYRALMHGGEAAMRKKYQACQTASSR
jgi:biotin-(acetyl-CoA carboxylase) ligase